MDTKECLICMDSLLCVHIDISFSITHPIKVDDAQWISTNSLKKYIGCALL